MYSCERGASVEHDGVGRGGRVGGCGCVWGEKVVGGQG